MRPVICFIDPDRSFVEVEIRRRQRQEFSLTEPAPVQHFESIVREGLIHHGFREFQVFLLRPELHFFTFLAANGPYYRGGVVLQTVVFDCMVQDCNHLIMDSLQVCVGIRFLVLVPIG